MIKQSQRPTSFTPRLRPLALLLTGLAAGTAHAGPEGGQVVAGQASIAQSGPLTRINQTSNHAVIDWRSFSVGSAERVSFNQPSRNSATLNRVTGGQASQLLGRIDANGQVILVNPNGVLIDKGASIDVGSLIVSTANISNRNFMDGRLQFDEAGAPGAGIVNRGSITAAEGGLVALVAPHVRNDGLIQARLGKVAIGAGDTFTIDLYGDALLKLAISDTQAAQLHDADGVPLRSLIDQRGSIEAAGGKVVLATAAQARSVLDNVINLSGTVRADGVAQQNGKIVLLGQGGRVEVSGELSASGRASGETGGTIEVLGDAVSLAATARLDVSGAAGGGTLRVGGGYQGKGDTYRAQQTQVAAGAILDASARTQGNGGEVVVWADGDTGFAGAALARGGTAGGNGGRIEVSGKHTLDYTGSADAGAPHGAGGSLLLDPEFAVIGQAQALSINTTLRTGTSVEVTSATDIDVNSQIDGRSGLATAAPGGGITLTANNSINLNESIVTNAGAIRLTATHGSIATAAGKGLFVMSGLTTDDAASAPISLAAAGDISLRTLVTSGTISAVSTVGSITLNERPDIRNTGLSLTAGQNLVIAPTVISTHNGDIGMAAGGGDGLNFNGKVFDAGTANIMVNALGNVTGGRYQSSGGNLNITSSGGAATGGSSSGSDQVEFGGINNLTILAQGTVDFGAFGGAVRLTSTAGNVNLSGGASGSLTVNAPAGDITGSFVHLSDATLIAGGNILLRSTRNSTNPINGSVMTFVDIRAGGDVTFTSGDPQHQNPEAVNVFGNLTVFAGRDFLIQNDTVIRGNLMATSSRDLISGARLSVQANGNAPGNADITAQNGKLEFVQTDVAGALNVHAASTIGILSPVEAVGAVTMTAPLIKLNSDVVGFGGITFNGPVLIHPSGDELQNFGGTYSDDNNDGRIDCPGECTPITTSAWPIKVYSSDGFNLGFGAPITFNGTVGLDPNYTVHAILQVFSGSAPIYFNDNVNGVNPEFSHSLQLAIGAGSLVLGSGVTLNASESWIYTGAGVGGYVPTTSPNGVSVNVLGFDPTMVQPWRNQDQPDLTDGNGVPIPPGPVATQPPFVPPIAYGDTAVTTNTPSTTSVALVLPPTFIGEIPVTPPPVMPGPTPSPTPGTNLLSDSSIPNTIMAADQAARGATVPGSSDSSSGNPDSTGETLFVFAEGRGSAQLADLGRGRPGPVNSVVFAGQPPGVACNSANGDRCD